jgi:hypothetical protein
MERMLCPANLDSKNRSSRLEFWWMLVELERSCSQAICFFSDPLYIAKSPGSTSLHTRFFFHHIAHMDRC